MPVPIYLPQSLFQRPERIRPPSLIQPRDEDRSACANQNDARPRAFTRRSGARPRPSVLGIDGSQTANLPALGGPGEIAPSPRQQKRRPGHGRDKCVPGGRIADIEDGQAHSYSEERYQAVFVSTKRAERMNHEIPRPPDLDESRDAGDETSGDAWTYVENVSARREIAKSGGQGRLNHLRASRIRASTPSLRPTPASAPRGHGRLVAEPSRAMTASASGPAAPGSASTNWPLRSKRSLGLLAHPGRGGQNVKSPSNMAF